MKEFGLIGKKLGHSFSKNYFSEKFDKENITDSNYELYELSSADELPNLIERFKGKLKGLNVTIPYKEDVLPFLSDIDPAAKAIGAVNVLKISSQGKVKGYNSDYYGFKTSLEKFLDSELNNLKALILGTGGASKAVKQALIDLGIDYKYVSRSGGDNQLSYEDLNSDVIRDHKLIINSTPLGMYPNIDSCPDLPYQDIREGHYLYDLVYNPEETLFMKKGRENGAKAIHGLEMLVLQAEKSWEIWNK